jgi:hypothetical protein
LQYLFAERFVQSVPKGIAAVQKSDARNLLQLEQKRVIAVHDGIQAGSGISVSAEAGVPGSAETGVPDSAETGVLSPAVNRIGEGGWWVDFDEGIFQA